MPEKARVAAALGGCLFVALSVGSWFYFKGKAPPPPASGMEAAESPSVARTPEQLEACRREESQRAAQEPGPPLPAPAQPVRLRSEPRDLSAEDCTELVRRWNFYSSDNPEGCFSNAYRTPREGLVEDLATGLTWQSYPSARPLTFAEVSPYLEKLNRERFGGFADWRLPTLEEAFSLMESLPMGDTHVDPLLFAAKKEWWTSDARAAENAQWVILTVSASCVLVPHGANPASHVRAVRSSR